MLCPDAQRYCSNNALCRREWNDTYSCDCLTIPVNVGVFAGESCEYQATSFCYTYTFPSESTLSSADPMTVTNSTTTTTTTMFVNMKNISHSIPTSLGILNSVDTTSVGKNAVVSFTSFCTNDSVCRSTKTLLLRDTNGSFSSRKIDGYFNGVPYRDALDHSGCICPPGYMGLHCEYRVPIQASNSSTSNTTNTTSDINSMNRTKSNLDWIPTLYLLTILLLAASILAALLADYLLRHRNRRLDPSLPNDIHNDDFRAGCVNDHRMSSDSPFPEVTRTSHRSSPISIAAQSSQFKLESRAQNEPMARIRTIGSWDEMDDDQLLSNYSSRSNSSSCLNSKTSNFYESGGCTISSFSRLSATHNENGDYLQLITENPV